MDNLPVSKPYRLEDAQGIKPPPDRGIWYVPKDKRWVSSTVTTSPLNPLQNNEDEADSVKYYNGYLICESVPKAEAILISYSPEMEKLLYKLIQIDAVQHFGKIQELQKEAVKILRSIQYNSST